MRGVNLYISMICIFSLIGCSKSSQNENSSAVEQRAFSEFTPIHPLTGQPLKPNDLNAEILKEDPILSEDLFEPTSDDVTNYKGRASLQIFPDDEITVQEISYPDVNVDKEKESAMFGYLPKGTYNAALSGACHFTNLESIMRANASYTSEIAEQLQGWQKLCEKELSRGRTSPLTTALRFENVKYDLQAHQYKPIEFHFTQDKTKLNALLFFKDKKVRPLIVFKSGLYGDAKDGGVLRNFIMHLLEESPFHVLYLANVTGEQFTKDNGDLFLGGFDEGRQILRVIQEVMLQPEISSLVHDIHVVGVSLGSHGVLYSALYSSFLPTDDYKIMSAFAFCPVVDLKPTMESVFDDSIRGIFYESLTLQFLKGILKFVPILGELFNLDKKMSRKELFHAIKKGTIENYIRRTQKTPWDLAPFKGMRIQDEEEFWKLNNFTEYANQNTVPTMVVHAKDDFLVLPDFNIDALSEKLKGQATQIGVVKFDNGSHCGFNVALGWPTISTLIREHVLRNTDYQNDEQSVQLSIFDKFKLPALKSRNVITSYSWDFNEKKKVFLLDINYYEPRNSFGGTNCSRYKPAMAPSFCHKNVQLKLTSQDLSEIRIGVPSTEKEYVRIARWLNTRAYLVDSENKNIIGSVSWPKTLVTKTMNN